MNAARETDTAPPLPILPIGLAVAGGVLSGLLYWTAFAGMDVWPLAFVAFVPLWISIQGQPPKRAFWLGALSGIAMNLGGFYWLLNMLRTFSGFPTPICLVFVVIVCGYQGLRLAVMTWLHARATQRGWPAIPVFLAAFVASELVYPLLFPWSFAATVHQVPWLTQTAELGGPILVGLVLLAANLAIAEPLLARIERRKVRPSVLVGGAATLLAALAFAAVRIPQVDAQVAAAEAIRVGVVQGNMGLMQKREDPAEGLRRHIRKTEELRNAGAELVVWSESSVTFPVHEDMARTMMKARVGQHLHVPAIFGGVLYRYDPDRERWFNVALSTNAAGDVTGRYDKEYLLQFGEHLPFGDTFPILYDWSPNSGKFSPGTKLDPLVVETASGAHKVGVLICYEDILPKFTNDLVAATKPELLVNITNDAWFGDTTEPWEHLALAQLRTVEHRRYLVRSTNSGVSAIVDPVGRVIAKTQTFRVETLNEVVRWLKPSRTVYEVLGDGPWWLASVAVIFAAFARRPRRRATV